MVTSRSRSQAPAFGACARQYSRIPGEGGWLQTGRTRLPAAASRREEGSPLVNGGRVLLLVVVVRGRRHAEGGRQVFEGRALHVHRDDERRHVPLLSKLGCRVLLTDQVAESGRASLIRTDHGHQAVQVDNPSR